MGLEVSERYDGGWVGRWRAMAKHTELKSREEGMVGNGE